MGIEPATQLIIIIIKRAFGTIPLGLLNVTASLDRLSWVRWGRRSKNVRVIINIGNMGSAVSGWNSAIHGMVLARSRVAWELTQCRRNRILLELGDGLGSCSEISVHEVLGSELRGSNWTIQGLSPFIFQLTVVTFNAAGLLQVKVHLILLFQEIFHGGSISSSHVHKVGVDILL